jgi:hypothetical protein
VKVGDLVKSKYAIDIGGNSGEILGKIKLGELGIVIDVELTGKRQDLCVAFNSDGTWWLTKDELEILSK